MKLIIGSDHGGFRLKEELKPYLKKKGYQLKDAGCFSQGSCDYPVYARKVAEAVSSGKYKRGLLICKSGIGNSIVSNKLPGVRAALCYSLKAARLSRQHNDANVLVLGALFVKKGLAKRIADTWLKTRFSGGRHIRRLRQIKTIERNLK